MVTEPDADYAPGAAFTITIRAEYPNQTGMLGTLTSAIGGAGGDIGAVDIVRVEGGRIIRDITVRARSAEHERNIVGAVKSVPGVTVHSVSDRTFLMHLGGKIAVELRVPVKTRSDLSHVYTPGVARVCMAIHADPAAVWPLTVKGNCVAVVTDGSAVLGLGNIGPEAALPVMEGKAMLFKAFGNVEAWPICLATQDVDEIVETVKRIAPGFGGINLEDISAPRCFEVEARLIEELDIPVFHDDQHGTAVVVMAALINALKVVGKHIADVRVVLSGVGAGGIACSKMLLSQGVREIIGVDRAGIIYKGRTEHMNPMKEWFAENTNPHGRRGTLSDAMEGADLFLGLSAPGLLTVGDVRRMAPNPMVFAMANPVPEIMPEEAAPYVAVMATGRSDYANQINNVLCFPGLFRGVLDVRASRITEGMKLAAARAIAGRISEEMLGPELIIPSVFDREVFSAVAKAVAQAAIEEGVARRGQTREAHVFV